MHMCLTSPAYIFNHTLLTDLFHITNEQRSSEVPPEDLFSLPHSRRKPQPNSFVCDDIVQLLRLTTLSPQRVSKLPCLRVLCIETLLPEIISGYFFFLGLKSYLSESDSSFLGLELGENRHL